MQFGPQETKLMFGLEMKKMSIFTFDYARDILQGTNSATWNVIGRLKKKKRLQKLENGKYLFVPARAGLEGHWSEDHWLIIPYLIDDYYVGFWTAMNFWGMTEQIPYTVFIATTRRKKNRILLFGKQKFQFVTISKKKFFGCVDYKIGKNNHFNISSKEKTIVDGLTHPEYCGGIAEVTKAMWTVRKEIDWNKVYHMAKKVKINVVLHRLGYLLTVLGIEKNLSEKIKKETTPYPYSFLDPIAMKERIAYSKEYGLILNRTKDDLTNWMEY